MADYLQGLLYGKMSKGGSIEITDGDHTTYEGAIGGRHIFELSEPKLLKSFFLKATSTSVEYNGSDILVMFYDNVGKRIYSFQSNKRSYDGEVILTDPIFLSTQVGSVEVANYASNGTNKFYSFDVYEKPPAQVGDQLLQPEAGWKRYDDAHPAIKYEGSWNSTGNAANYYNGTRKISSTAGNSLEFNFIGTQLRIMAANGATGSANIRINIDGIEEQFSTKSSATLIYQSLVYEKVGLDNKIHTVKITHIEAGDFTSDAYDIDSGGRFLHPEEVTDVKDLTVGKRIRCHYQATANRVGVFSGLGEETSDFIPPASSATPNGDFYFIMVEDWNGKKRLVADRNIQHSISWDTLNSAGIASGSGVEIPYNKNYSKLISYFTFDESNGNILDNVGSAVGSIVNGVTRVPSLSGNALNFNGTSSYVRFNQKVIPVGKKSIRFKINRNDETTDFQSILTTLTSTGNNGWWIYISRGKLNFYSRDSEGSSSGTISSETVLKENIWYDVLITFSGTDDVEGLKLYVNDFSTPEAVGGLSRAEANSEGNLILGGRQQQTWGQFFNGRLDELEIYSDVINPIEDKSYEKTIRLLTGGTSSTYKDNEWDRHIVNSTLNGSIAAGDNSVWNWDIATRSWTSTTMSTNTAKVGRGYLGSLGGHIQVASHTTATTYGFRPVLEIEAMINIMSLVYEGGHYKKWIDGWNAISDSLPSGDSFKKNGLSNLSSLRRTVGSRKLPMHQVPSLNNIFKREVDLKKYSELVRFEANHSSN